MGATPFLDQFASNEPKPLHELKLFPLKFAFEHSDLADRFDSQLLKYDLLPKRRNKKMAVEISAWGGINSVNFNYQANGSPNLAEIKEQSTSSALGTSSGLSANMLLNDHYLISSGLEYHQLWSKLDYEFTTTKQVVKENQLLKVWVDGVSGDTLNRLYGDTTVNAIDTREVVHYNKFQQFSIPIEIGIQKQTTKFVYGISAGGVFNFTLGQSGKTINSNNEVVEFDKDNPARPFKSFSIGLRLKPFVAYRISEHLSLKIQPHWTWQPSIGFDTSDTKLSIHQVNLNLGIGYSFH